MKRSELIKIRNMIEKASKSLSDTDALEVKELFPSYAVGHSYIAGDRFEYDGKLYKVLQPHISQEDWIPSSTPSLYTEVGQPEQGDSPDNPIPYNNNMELFNGKYYSQFDVVYVCFRDTGIPVYHNLADLVGLYVERWVEENAE